MTRLGASPSIPTRIVHMTTPNLRPVPSCADADESSVTITLTWLGHARRRL